jgi:putative ABC transport system permease protein
MVEEYNFHASVYIPYSVMMNIGGWGDAVDSIEIKVNDPQRIAETSEMIISHMERRHENEGKGMYETFNVSSYLEQSQMVFTIISLFLSAVAAISLLVGGIGVMNIMLVSVTERTREIGIRKSIGATNASIQIQFLFESVILTGIGGIAGTALGYFGGVAVGSLIGVQAGFSIEAAYIAVGVSSFIGVVFGVYPAAKAARLDPVEALRFE